MTKIEKLSNKLNDDFRDILGRMMLARFGVTIETEYNFVESKIISTRVDGRKFTKRQVEFMQDFEEGYHAAWGIVREAM